MKQTYNIIYGITYHSVCTSRWCGVPCTPFSQYQRQVFCWTRRPHHKNVHSPQPDNCNYKYNSIMHRPWCNWNTEWWKVPNYIQEEDISQLHMPTTQIGGHVELAKPNILSWEWVQTCLQKPWKNDGIFYSAKVYPEVHSYLYPPLSLLVRVVHYLVCLKPGPSSQIHGPPFFSSSFGTAKVEMVILKRK